VSENIDVDDSVPFAKNASIMRTPLALLNLTDDIGETRKLTDFKARVASPSVSFLLIPNVVVCVAFIR
jgi:hypothetical protein